MSLSLSYSSLIYLKKCRLDSRFGGSSKYKVVNNQIIEKPKKIKHIPLVTLDNTCEDENLTRILKPFEEEHFNNEDIKKWRKPTEIGDIENSSGSMTEPAEKKKQSYKLNKSKLKKKCFAFSRLEKSKTFLAFYSISFPIGLIDDKAYKVYNTWLTRCRKDCNLKSYIWVAERQGNGTIHFHLLTNDFMPIKTVNGYMANALKSEKKKGTDALQTIDPEKYNGVDVKKVQPERKALIKYLVKYISKNDIEFYRLPWHCSHDISRLFTSENFEVRQFEEYTQNLPRGEKDYEEKYIYYENEYLETLGFKFNPDEVNYHNIDTVNQIIYNNKLNF